MSDEGGLPADLERIAVSVALDAARHVAAHAATATGSGPGGVDHKSTRTDLVTDVDRSTEARLIAAIQARRPADAILGEESGAHDGTASGGAVAAADRVEWVIDPIDGTVNFVLGLPIFSVSVAARLGGRTIAGCVVDVGRMEVFRAHLGGGSWLSTPSLVNEPSSQRRLSGPRGVDLAEAVVATGFAYDARVRGRQGAVLAGLMARIGNLRRLGSAALDLCNVAAGRVDAYFEAGLKEWDRAAGMLIAQEAGARVGVLTGRDGEVTVAAAVGAYEQLAGVLGELGAEHVFGT